MRVASSGAHDFVAAGGASALGSIASFGWIAPQAAKRPAKPASEALGFTVRVDFDGREVMNQSDLSGRASAVSGPRTATITDQGRRPGA